MIDEANKDGNVAPEEPGDVSKEREGLDREYGEGKFDALENMRNEIGQIEERNERSEQFTPVFIAAMTDAVNAPVNSEERAFAIGRAMRALEDMRDDYGNITLSDEALKVLPKQQPNYSYDRRNPAPPRDNVLEVKSPSDIIAKVSGELARRYEGKAVTPAELSALRNAKNKSTSMNNDVDDNDDVSVTNPVKKQTVYANANTNTTTNTKTTPEVVTPAPVKEAPKFALTTVAADAAPMKGEPGVTVPKISADQLGSLHKQLRALAAVEGNHPALDALVQRLDSHPKEEGRNFGKLTLAALAEATGMKPAELAKLDLRNADASKDLIAKLQLPVKKEEVAVTTTTKQTVTDNVPAATNGLGALTAEQTTTLQANLVKAGLLTQEQANGKWDKDQVAALSTALEKSTTDPKLIPDAFVKDPLGSYNGRTFVDIAIASTADVATAANAKSTSEAREILASTELHTFLQQAAKVLKLEGDDAAILAAIEQKYKGEAGVTVNGKLDVKELITAAEKLQEAQDQANSPFAFLANKEQKKAMKELPTTMKALDDLLNKEGIVKIDGVYADTKPVNTDNLGISNGGSKDKTNLVQK